MHRRLARVVATLVVILAAPAVARADITAFLGATGQPSNRTTTGFAFGLGLLIVGFEFEYSRAREDELAAAPALTTGMANVLLQTPSVSGIQVYGTVGAGGYRERLGTEHEVTSFGTNVGGGMKLALAGPLRLRLDYRIFVLKGSPLYQKPQRFYAGLNFSF